MSDELVINENNYVYKIEWSRSKSIEAIIYLLNGVSNRDDGDAHVRSSEMWFPEFGPKWMGEPMRWNIVYSLVAKEIEDWSVRKHMLLCLWTI